MSGCVAVFDLGKTNRKLVVFDRTGKILAEKFEPNAPLPPDADWPYLRLDTEGAWAFLTRSLKSVAVEFSIEAISITTHGASCALVTDVDLALPPMDYEFEGFQPVDADYDALRPPFQETLSPKMPRGLNAGRMVFYAEQMFPKAFARATAFLTYPQYWAWRLSGVKAIEVTSIGSHTDLWAPREARLSSMVEKLGWTRLMPPLCRGWETLGPIRPEVAQATGLPASVRVVCGAHDSNASLVPHLIARTEPFTVLSTGTWVIIMAVGGTGPLYPELDMLANVDVRGELVPTGRFMGGREFSILAGDARAEPCAADIAGVMALPDFVGQGGPFLGKKGGIVGNPPQAPEGRVALATLYSALMSAHVLDLLQAPGDLIVEGGFNRSPAFAATLAGLMPGRNVAVAPTSGAAAGAAMLANWQDKREPPRLSRAESWVIPGLADYRGRWEWLASESRGSNWTDRVRFAEQINSGSRF